MFLDASLFCGLSLVEDFWTRGSGNPNLVSVLPWLNNFDLVIGVGAEVPVYGSGCSFAANVARRLDSHFCDIRLLFV